MTETNNLQPLVIPQFIFDDIERLKPPRRQYTTFINIATVKSKQWLQTHFDDQYVGFKAAIVAYDKRRNTIATHCMTCGKPLTVKQIIQGHSYCSHKCAANNKDKQAKTAATNLAKYGCTSVLQNSDILAKKQQTSIERYGTDYVKIARAKASETNIAKYGSATPFNGSKRNQAQVTHRTNFYDRFVETLVEHHLKLLTPKQQYIDGCRLLTYQCIDCGNIWTTDERDVYHMTNCSCRKNRSIGEVEIAEYVKTIYDDQILTNDRQLAGFELDVVLPNINVAFEYNGVYWHSSNRPIDYHLNKTVKCKQLGITLYHIWEYDYVNKPNVIKDIINQAVNPVIIDGNCLNKTVISESQYIDFVNQYSLQQPIVSNRIIGLADTNNDLIATVSYTLKDTDVNIDQYTTKNSVSIRNAFERLFANCQLTIKANIDYQQQLPLMDDGFTVIQTIDPQPTYTRNLHVLSEQQVRQYNSYTCNYNCGFQVLTKELF